MPSYALFLRAINVAGHNTVVMADLQSLIEARGFDGVTTLLNSGNVVFTGADRPVAELESQFEAAIGRKLEVDCNCFVRTTREWSAAIASNPFPAEAKNDPGHLLVLCLKSAPSKHELAALRGTIVGRERVEAVGKQLYAYYPDGVGRSRLTVQVIEKHLATRATGRNWNTALKVADLLGR